MLRFICRSAVTFSGFCAPTMLTALTCDAIYSSARTHVSVSVNTETIFMRITDDEGHVVKGFAVYSDFLLANPGSGSFYLATGPSGQGFELLVTKKSASITFPIPQYGYHADCVIRP